MLNCFSKLVSKCKPKIISIRGRIKNIREMGKNLVFLDLFDPSCNSSTQIMFKQNSNSTLLKQNLLTIGSILQVTGTPIETTSGQPTILAHNCHSLSFPITKPISWNTGLKEENSLRNRHLDLLINPESRRTFELRFKMFKFIRDYLDALGFVEVETPILSSCYSGANAEPFVVLQGETEKSNFGYDEKLYLRISPELHLKRLIIGGFERIFEIGKQFRNEAADSRHNPEFTSLELYQAYSSVNDLFEFTEQFLESLCAHLHSGRTDNGGIQFKGPYQRIDVSASLLKELGIQSLEEMNSSLVHAYLNERDIKIQANYDLAHGIEKIIEHSIERKLGIQPTFLFNHPTAISPLAKPSDRDANVAERFELFVNGMELINAYSELTNPSLQLENFKRNLRKDCDLDKSTHNSSSTVPKDLIEYCEALECGMPPTAGWGIGLDRLAMLVTSERAQIKKVILFPFLTSKKPN